MIYKTVLLVALFFTFMTGVLAQEPAAVDTDAPLRYTNIGVDEMQQLMKGADVIVLDVRTPAEIAHGKIRGAVVIDVLEKGFEERFEALNKDKTYLVYCRSGRRSVNACNVMADQGFGKLYNLEGGFNAWREAKKPVYVPED